MNDDKCLCIGTFFSLIIEGLPNGGSKRKGIYANYAVMENLIKVVSPNFKWGNDNKSTVTSKLKECLPYGHITPLTDKICRDTFDELVREDYQAALERMSSFAKIYVSTEKKDWLASALIELLHTDDPHGKNAFFATENGKSINTRYLTEWVHFIEPLLLGIWHHIVMNCHDNTIGKTVLASWYKPKDEKHDTAEFISNIGKNPKFQIKVDFLDTTSLKSTTSENASCGNEHNESIYTTASDRNTHIKHYYGKGSIQIAQNIYNIEHVENLN